MGRQLFCCSGENMSIIKIENLVKTYEGAGSSVTALNGVSLEVNEGEIFGIIGLSGAGKSTLVRCINLLETPTSGTVTVNGQDLQKLSQEQLRIARRKIGMIFQSFNLLQQKTALENVCFPLELSGVSRTEAVKKAEKLLDTVGLGDRLKSYPSQLSGGQQQRVAIARALANEPSVLLCDECTSALDPTTTLQILELLQKINRELGVTIVIITHEMKVIEKICTRVAILAESKVAEMGEVSEVFRHPKTAAAKKLIFPGRTPGCLPGRRQNHPRRVRRERCKQSCHICDGPELRTARKHHGSRYQNHRRHKLRTDAHPASGRQFGCRENACLS